MGFFSLGMARLVGDSGKVLSVDLQQSEITLAANAINVTEGMRLRESVQE